MSPGGGKALTAAGCGGLGGAAGSERFSHHSTAHACSAPRRHVAAQYPSRMIVNPRDTTLRICTRDGANVSVTIMFVSDYYLFLVRLGTC